jgi:hypothetical protein
MTSHHGRLLTLKDGSRVPYVTQGAYADVFIDRHVYKVFKVEPENGLRETPRSVLDQKRRDTFETQVDAYKIAARDAVVAPHVPKLLGVGTAIAVHDAAGNDVSREYHLECSYEMELQQGQAQDLDHLSDNAPQHIKDFAERCMQIGIEYVRDASVFHRDYPETFVMIDFGTKEIDMPY